MAVFWLWMFVGVAYCLRLTSGQANKDVIWFPTDESDDKFVSNYGEKWRYLVPEWNVIKRSRERRSQDLTSRYGGDWRHSFLGPPPPTPQYPFGRPQFGDSGRPPPRRKLVPVKENGRQRLPTIDDLFGNNNNNNKEQPPTEFETQFGQDRKSRNPQGQGTGEQLVFPGSGPDRPTRPTKPRPSRPTTSSTTTAASSTEASLPSTTTMSPCERQCPVTPEFNPVCGSDSNNYTNPGRLKCAQMCGKDVEYLHHGNCGPRST